MRGPGFMQHILDEWRRRGSDYFCRDQRLFVIDEGDAAKPVLLLIHGFPTSSWDWHGVWPYLGEHFRIIAPDMLGFGFSAKPHGHRYTIFEQADLIEMVLEQMDVRHCHVLAHDYGDTVAQELLARDNERAGRGRCLTVAMLNGGLFPEATRPRRIQHLLAGPLGGLIVRFVNRGTLERNMRTIFGPNTPPSAQDIDVFWELIQRDGGRMVFHRLIRYMRERDVHRTRWLSALQETPVPRLLINGLVDPVSGARMVARYRELITQDNIVELPTIGHYPQMEAAQDVARHYLDFVQPML